MGGVDNVQEKYAAVPEELKILPQWVIHTDKKIPYNPKTLKRAKSNEVALGAALNRR